MKYRIIWCTFLALIMFGCATGTKFTVSEPIPKPIIDNTTLLYVFRGPSSPTLLKPTIYINDIEVADLRINSCIEINLKPGIYNIKSKWSVLSGVSPRERSIDVNVLSGKSYYIHISTSLPWVAFIPYSFTGAKHTVEFTDATTAMPILNECEKAESREGVEYMIMPK